MAATPTKRALRKWTVAQLDRTLDAIHAELHRRDQEHERARLAEQEIQLQRAAELRARTVIGFRHILQSVKCGKAACHCMKGGEPHPGYWYRIDTYADGHRRKRYVGKTKPRRMAS